MNNEVTERLYMPVIKTKPRKLRKEEQRLVEPGDSPGCCDLGHNAVFYYDGRWVLTSMLMPDAEKPLQVHYCPFCGQQFNRHTPGKCE